MLAANSKKKVVDNNDDFVLVQILVENVIKNC